MKLRMLKLAAGPEGVLLEGRIYDLPQGRAEGLIAAGAGEALADPPVRAKAVQAEAPETAALKPAGEKAVRKPARPRGPGDED